MARLTPLDADREGVAALRDARALVPAAIEIGGPGDDRLIGTAGPDRLAGRAGADLLRGLAGPDELQGGRGADILAGHRGADRLIGGRGGDELRGGFGADVLRAGPGADLLDGGRGSDALTGGGGADVFRLGALGALDRILDFDQAGGDQLDLGPLLERVGPADRIEDFVELRVSPEGTLVAVDPSGSGGAFVDAALLVDTVLDDPARVPNPIAARIEPGEIAVELVDFLQAPASSPTQPIALLNDLPHAGDGSGRLFAVDGRGFIWVIDEGALRPDPFLDLPAILGPDLVSGGQSGLRGLAFHPDFAVPGTPGFGKVYTSVTLSVGSADEHLDTPVFASPGPDSHHDAIIEWSIDPADPNRIDPASGRELLRIEQPLADHNIGAIGFDPDAAAGGPDFGLLYAGIGDGGLGVEQPNGQDTGNLLGKIIRIDPLQNGARPYAVPDGNPFVGDPDVLPEIWAVGLRHPQFLSWDQGGRGQMLIADIGEANLEEVNFGSAGANYGWREREGTFAFEPGADGGLFELPAFDASFDFTYPVAQYDHDDGAAIAGGFVYRGSQVPELVGQYVFGDIVNGRIFHVDVADLELGRQAPIDELTLLRDGEPITLLELVDAPRADLRFGQDEDGEIYVMTKQDGMIRSLAPAEASAVPASGSGLDAVLTPGDPGQAAVG